MFDVAPPCTVCLKHPLNEYKRSDVTRVVQDFYAADPKRGFYGGGGFDARFGFNPIGFAMRVCRAICRSGRGVEEVSGRNISLTPCPV